MRAFVVVVVATSTALRNVADALGIGSGGRGLDLSRGGERGTPQQILVVEMVCESSRSGGGSAMCRVASEVLDLSEPNEYFTFARE